MARESALEIPHLTEQLATIDVTELDAERLSPEAEKAASELLSQGRSENTTRSYRAALRYWASWYFARYRRSIALPVSVPTVLQFVVDHAQRLDSNNHPVSELPDPIDRALVNAGFKRNLGAPSLSTLEHRISVLSQMHTLRGLKNPCQDPAVRELLGETRRGYAKRGIRPRAKDALARDPFEKVLVTCDESLRGKRDRALLLFAWSSGGRRRSEVAAATFENLKKTSDGYVYDLAFSKSNQEGGDRPDNHKPLLGTAAAALEAWLSASRITSGALFRRIRKGDRVAEALSPGAVRDIVKARCAQAGVEGDFSAHSLRSGFVTEASIQGAPLGDIMAMTGHASASTVLRYHRRAHVSSNPAARLLSSGVDGTL